MESVLLVVVEVGVAKDGGHHARWGLLREAAVSPRFECKGVGAMFEHAL